MAIIPRLNGFILLHITIDNKDMNKAKNPFLNCNGTEDIIIRFESEFLFIFSIVKWLHSSYKLSQPLLEKVKQELKNGQAKD
jgi:hypothetical protein